MKYYMYIIGVILLLSLLGGYYYKYQRLKKQVVDYRGENILLRDESTIYVDNKGYTHLKSEVAVVTNIKTVKDNKLLAIKGRTRKMDYASATVTHTEIKESVVFKDSIIHDTVKVKCIDWSNKFASIKGCDGDSITLRYTDTTRAVITWRRVHKFLFIHWGRKEYEVDIYSTNPNSKIVVSKTAILKGI